jgi:hypothetical protein
MNLEITIFCGNRLIRGLRRARLRPGRRFRVQQRLSESGRRLRDYENKVFLPFGHWMHGDSIFTFGRLILVCRSKEGFFAGVQASKGALKARRWAKSAQ